MSNIVYTLHTKVTPYPLSHPYIFFHTNSTPHHQNPHQQQIQIQPTEKIHALIMNPHINSSLPHPHPWIKHSFANYNILITPPDTQINISGYTWMGEPIDQSRMMPQSSQDTAT
jgi:hypothetical protein